MILWDSTTTPPSISKQIRFGIGKQGHQWGHRWFSLSVYGWCPLSLHLDLLKFRFCVDVGHIDPSVDVGLTVYISIAAWRAFI